MGATARHLNRAHGARALATSNSRCRTITLVTTLTDPKLWPVKLLAALYHRRWKIELYWDDIKTVLQMDMLSCKTPAMVHKEIQMHLIAYNLIRALMAEAALTAHVPLERVSFTGNCRSRAELPDGLDPPFQLLHTPSTMINLTPKQLRKAADIQEKIQSLQEELGQLLGAEVSSPVQATEPRKKYKFSAAARAKMRAAQKQDGRRLKRQHR